MNKDSLQQSVQEVLDGLVADGTERGTQVVAYVDGELVLNAWAGVMGAEDSRLVTGETLFPVFSTTKGMMATIVHRLAERRLLAYDTPIAEYWPEFAANGKEKITLRQAMSHTSALPYIPPGIELEDLNNWEVMCRALADAAPAYEPGSKVEYHAITYGWLLGECACRVTGLTIAEVWEQELQKPLKVSGLYCGIPEALNSEVATLEDAVPFEVTPPETPTPQSVPWRAQPLSQWMNIKEARAACLPASNGIMTARAIAKHYAALLPGGVEGIELLPPERVAEVTKPGVNPEGNESPVFALGYAPKGTGFGHGGYGGSLGMADLSSRLAFGFTRNRLGEANTADVLLGVVQEWMEKRG